MEDSPQGRNLMDKTNFILKSINLQAIVFSVDQVVMTFPVILVRAFEGLFEERVMGLNYSPTNRFQREYNCDIILTALYDKFKFSAFQDVSGKMILDGQLSSIECIVDILYEVAKRVARKREYEQLEIPGIQTDKVLNYKAVASDAALQEFYFIKKQMNAKDDINAVLKRICNMKSSPSPTLPEDRTAHKEKVASKKKSKNKKKWKAQQKLTTAQPKPNVQPQEDKVMLKPDEAVKTPVVGGKQRTVCRPQSAPQPTRKSPRKQPQLHTQSPSNQRHRVRAEGDAPVADGFCRQKEAHRSAPGTVYDRMTGRRVAVSELRKIEEDRWNKFLQRGHYQQLVTDMDDEYSSDSGEEEISGRPAQSKPVWGSPMRNAPDRTNSCGSPERGAPPTSPPISGVSGRNAQSIDSFVQKMRSLREGGVAGPTSGGVYEQFDTPVHWPCYDSMLPLDIIISVEHCVNCEHHKKSVRHDAEEYRQRSCDVLKHLMEQVHNYGPCARVGVVCQEADLDLRGPHFHRVDVENGPGQVAESRLGALEVQIAIKLEKKGYDQSSFMAEVLHSKLKTRMWPNKKALVKKLISFLRDAGVKSYKTLNTTDRNGFLGEVPMAYQGSTYPVGIVDWTDVTLSADDWSYQQAHRRTDHSPEKTHTCRSPSARHRDVCWAFDGSPLNWVGEEVVVRNTALPLASDSIHGKPNDVPEKYSFLAHVVWADCMDNVIVRPQYFDCEINCLIKNCSVNKLDESMMSDPSRARYEYVTSRSRLPLPLHVVLNFAADEHMCDWKVLNSKDERKWIVDADGRKHEDVFLCRASFYRQIRELVWVAQRCRPGEMQSSVVDYTATEVENCNIDAQLAYADIVLDWVFREVEDAAKADGNTFGGQVSMNRLVKWARSGHEYHANLMARPVYEVVACPPVGDIAEREDILTVLPTAHSQIKSNPSASNQLESLAQPQRPVQISVPNSPYKSEGVVVVRMSVGGAIIQTDEDEQKQVNVVVYATLPKGTEISPTPLLLCIENRRDYPCLKCVRRYVTSDVDVDESREYFDCIFSIRGSDAADIVRCWNLAVQFNVIEKSSPHCESRTVFMTLKSS